MKRLFVALALVLFFSGIASAQSNTSVAEPANRIMGIGTITTPLTAEERNTILPKEVKATVKLYLQGTIDQWWFRRDTSGVVFLLNVSTKEEALSIVEKLPLGVAKRMTFEFIPVGPLKPLQFLLKE